MLEPASIAPAPSPRRITREIEAALNAAVQEANRWQYDEQELRSAATRTDDDGERRELLNAAAACSRMYCRYREVANAYANELDAEIFTQANDGAKPTIARIMREMERRGLLPPSVNDTDPFDEVAVSAAFR